MDIQTRDKMFNSFIKIPIHCTQHPQEVANMMVPNQQSQNQRIICSNCLEQLSKQQSNISEAIKSLKIILFHIHQSSKSLIHDVSTAAFVDHHMLLIRTIAKNHFHQIEDHLQSTITIYFQKAKDLLNGRYFQEFYLIISSILAIRAKQNEGSNKNEEGKLIKKLTLFISKFQKIVTEYDGYENLPFEQKMSGKVIAKQIRFQVGEVYKQFKEKIQNQYKNWQEEQILSIFNPTFDSSKFFKFSSSLKHHSLKIIDPKKIKMPDLPDNEHSFITLIEPCIGTKKKSIKLLMQGIKGWVAIGIAYRSKVESVSFIFDNSNHGTVQLAYDGYTWSTDDPSLNEQYTNWYFNENDIVTVTANPSSRQLTFIKNQNKQNPYILKYTNPKNQKVHFCVSTNYLDDAVSIVQ